MKKMIALSLVFMLSMTLQAQKKTTQHGKMMSKDCVMMEDGKLMQMKDGKTMDLTSDLTLKNGTVVTTDGTVKMKNGKSTKLKNGDCVWMNGQITHKSMKPMKKESMKKKTT